MLNKLGHHTAFLGKVGDDIIADAKIFHFGTLSMTNEPVRSATRHAIKVTKENGAILSFDPNIREPLWKDMEDAGAQMAYGLSICDILKISDNEIQWFSRKEDYTEGIHMLQQHPSSQQEKVPCVSCRRWRRFRTLKTISKGFHKLRKNVLELCMESYNSSLTVVRRKIAVSIVLTGLQRFLPLF